MYIYDIDSRTGSTFVKPAFILLTTAATTFAHPNVNTDIDLTDYNLQVVTQSKSENINPYYSLSDNISFYNEIINTSPSELDSLIRDSYNQVQELGFISVNEEMDRKIDSYFTKKSALKIKKVIYSSK